MRCKAVDRHNMMGGSALRVEELKIRTFVFQFLGLVLPGVGVGSVLFIVTPGYCASTPASNTLTYQPSVPSVHTCIDIDKI